MGHRDAVEELREGCGYVGDAARGGVSYFDAAGRVVGVSCEEGGQLRCLEG